MAFLYQLVCATEQTNPKSITSRAIHIAHNPHNVKKRRFVAFFESTVRVLNFFFFGQHFLTKILASLLSAIKQNQLTFTTSG